MTDIIAIMVSPMIDIIVSAIDPMTNIIAIMASQTILIVNSQAL